MIEWVLGSHSSSVYTLIIYLPNMCCGTETIKQDFNTIFVCYTLYYIVYATLYIWSNFTLFRIGILCTFRKCILSYTSNVHFLIFRSVYEKGCISAEHCSCDTNVTNLKNMTLKYNFQQETNSNALLLVSNIESLLSISMKFDDTFIQFHFTQRQGVTNWTKL